MKKCPACDALYANRFMACPRCKMVAPLPSEGEPTSGWLRTRTRNNERPERAHRAPQPPTSPIDATALRNAMLDTSVSIRTVDEKVGEKVDEKKRGRARDLTPQVMVHDDYLLESIDAPVASGLFDGNSESLIAPMQLIEDSSAMGLGRRSSSAWSEEPTRAMHQAVEQSGRSDPSRDEESPLTVENWIPEGMVSEAFFDGIGSEAEETREFQIDDVGAETVELGLDDVESVGLVGLVEFDTETEDDAGASGESIDEAMDAVLAAADALFVGFDFDFDLAAPLDEPMAELGKENRPTSFPVVKRPALARGESRIREARRSEPEVPMERLPVEVDFGLAPVSEVVQAPVDEAPITDHLAPMRATSIEPSSLAGGALAGLLGFSTGALALYLGIVTFWAGVLLGVTVAAALIGWFVSRR